MKLFAHAHSPISQASIRAGHGLVLAALLLPLAATAQDDAPVVPEPVPRYYPAEELNYRELEVLQAPIYDVWQYSEELELLERLEVPEAMELDALQVEYDALEIEAGRLQIQAEMLEAVPETWAVDYLNWDGPQLRVVVPQAPKSDQEPVSTVLPAPRSRNRGPRAVIGGNGSELKDTYQAAYSLVLDEKWAEAEATLVAFITNSYQNRYTDDATFWYVYTKEKLTGSSGDIFDAYYAFIKQYPESSWEDDAKANLIRLGRELVTSDRRNRGKYEPVLEELRKDYDLKVALSALYGLRRIGDENSLAAIMKIYDSSSNEELRKNVVSILGRFDDPKVVAKLAEIARKDRSDAVRANALESLSRFDEDSAISALTAIAREDVDPDIRSKAVAALARTRGTQLVINTLEQIARTDVHVKVRTQAVSALGRIGTIEAQEALIRILEGK